MKQLMMLSMLLTMLLTMLLSPGLAFADNLALDVKAKDISVKGVFAFQPGSTLKISGNDVAGKAYEVELVSKIQKDDVIQFFAN